MSEAKRCPNCGVPKGFSKENVWNTNGTITQARNPDHRMFFNDVESLSRLFSNIQELLGVPVDHIIIEGERKACLEYLQYLYPGFKRAIMRVFRGKTYGMMAKVGAIFGLGHLELLDFKKKAYVKSYGRDVYNLLLMCGDLMAVFNHVEGLPAELKVEERGDGYEITMVPGEGMEEEVSSRLEVEVMRSKPGDIALPRCPECNMPLDFKAYTWDIDRGIITNTVTGKRVALTAPGELNSIFRELEAELGEEIPRTVLEAQRRYVVEAFKDAKFGRLPDSLRLEFAKRGLGNIVGFELKDGGLDAVIENVCVPLVVAGTMQGICDLLTGKESVCDHSYDKDGTLTVAISAAEAS